MVVTVSSAQIRNEMSAWLTPLNIAFSVNWCELNRATDRNAAYRRSARLDHIDCGWRFGIDFKDRDEELLFLLKFGEHV